MAKSGQVQVAGGAVTQLGDNSDIGTDDAVMIQQTGPHRLYVLPTTDATPPSFDTVKANGIHLPPGLGLNDTLANLFPDGLIYVRIWAAADVSTTAICYHP